MNHSISNLLAACTALGLTMAAANTQAQNYYGGSYGQSSYGYNSGDLGQYIFALDQYSDQMLYLYSMEARGYCGCTNAAALVSEMRRYNGSVHNLMGAYRGTCPTTFRNAACGVRDSLSRIELLRSRARVSPQVCGLISQSCPLASYVHDNSAMFRPVCAPTPSYPVYQGGSSCAPPVPSGHYHDRNRGGIDVKSAIFGAVAGRVIHGIVHGH